LHTTYSQSLFITMHLRCFSLILSAARSDHVAAESASLLQLESPHRHEGLKPIVEDDLPVYNGTTDQILVFSEQKTGSNTLQDTLGKVTPQHERLVQFDPDMLMEVYPPSIKTHYGQIARDFLEKTPPGKNVWVFKSVRNTYARATSYFFQQLCTFGKSVARKEEDQKACKEELAIDKLDNSTMHKLEERFDSWMKSNYMSQLQNESMSVAIPSVFTDITGVDVFQTKFKDGRLVFEQNRGTDKLYVVVLRLEEVDKWETILKPMFPDYKAGGTNLGEDKWYAAAYDMFKARYKFSDEAVSELRKADLDSRFYTQSEWEGFEASAKGVDRA